MTDRNSLTPSEVAQQLLKQHKSHKTAGVNPTARGQREGLLTFSRVSPRAKKKPSAANNYKPGGEASGSGEPPADNAPRAELPPPPPSRWERLRARRLTVGASAVILFGVIYSAGAMFQPSTEELTQQGKMLFEHEWKPHDPLAAGGDGLGPVFNAKSCVACHFQGGVGGAGPNDNNVTAFEVEPRPNHPDTVVNGVVHAAAISPDFKDTVDYVRKLFPIVRKGERIIGTCNTVTVHDFDPLRVTSINTPPLFGAGQIDGISDGAIQRNMYRRAVKAMGKELQLEFDSTPMGRYRLLDDGRVGKFGWKGQFATLEEFVATACAVEVGLTNPHRAQEKPRHQGADEEAGLDLNGEQFLALVTFCETLPAPKMVLPDDSAACDLVREGQQAFTAIGCADCHTPDLGGVEGLYSDLLLHRIAPPDHGGSSYGRVERDIPIPDNYPKPDEWKTPPLWGVADTAPYFHDGQSPTLEAAIERHHGDAERVRDRYREASPREQQAIIAFLKSLKAPQPTSPVQPANEIIAVARP